MDKGVYTYTYTYIYTPLLFLYIYIYKNKRGVSNCHAVYCKIFFHKYFRFWLVEYRIKGFFCMCTMIQPFKGNYEPVLVYMYIWGHGTVCMNFKLLRQGDWLVTDLRGGRLCLWCFVPLKPYRSKEKHAVAICTLIPLGNIVAGEFGGLPSWILVSFPWSWIWWASYEVRMRKITTK